MIFIYIGDMLLRQFLDEKRKYILNRCKNNKKLVLLIDKLTIKTVHEFINI